MIDPSQWPHGSSVLTPILLSTPRLREAEGPLPAHTALRPQSRDPHRVHLTLALFPTRCGSGGITFSAQVTCSLEEATRGWEGSPWKDEGACAHGLTQLRSMGSSATRRPGGLHPPPRLCFSLLSQSFCQRPHAHTFPCCWDLWHDYRFWRQALTFLLTCAGLGRSCHFRAQITAVTLVF